MPKGNVHRTYIPIHIRAMCEHTVLVGMWMCTIASYCSEQVD